MGLFLSKERAASCNAREPPGVSNICRSAGGAPLGRSTVPPPGSSRVRATCAASGSTAEHMLSEPAAAPPTATSVSREGEEVRSGDVCKLSADGWTRLVCDVSSLPALRGEPGSRATGAGSQAVACTLQSDVPPVSRVSASLVTSAPAQRQAVASAAHSGARAQRPQGLLRAAVCACLRPERPRSSVCLTGLDTTRIHHRRGCRAAPPAVAPPPAIRCQWGCRPPPRPPLLGLSHASLSSAVHAAGGSGTRSAPVVSRC
mmetsp:Transcript_20900/g.49515  ORF Transcript_20900/g.49515 Transcript_20900/m.49515 type:complete len:259 (+) Transcript_20900:632-1408(+)|eukprot:scaffold16733_cov55-Phaeocystis_antarctica.AAC.6